ncbi:MAG TPA: TRCF domain-containing protein, partial [Desulfuromonadales bacterium]|nr:TRCF domain-containing protein [Desulfuromonadales bacterium]
EIRGAGDLLGASQSGQMTAVGLEMYSDLLEETVCELKGLEKEEKVDPEVRLGLSAFLPEDYIEDTGQRLAMYQKLAGAEAEEEIYETADEMRDRFGEIPEAGQLLLDVMRLRINMKRLKIEQAEYDGRQLVLAFHASTPVPPERILERLKTADGRYHFTPDYRLTVQLGKLAVEEVLPAVKKELQALL